MAQEITTPIQWSQKILLISDDPQVQSNVRNCFGRETDLKIIGNTAVALEELQNQAFNAVIVDSATTDPKAHYSEEKKDQISFTEVIQFTNQTSPGIMIILLVAKLTAKEGDFVRKSGATMIIDRNSISKNLIMNTLRALRRRTYRTILTRDLVVGATYPFDIHAYIPMKEKYGVFLKAGTAYSDTLKNTLTSHLIRHLYLHESDLAEFYKTARTNPSVASASEELGIVRNLYRTIVSRIYDCSTDGMIAFGKELAENAKDIVTRVENLVNSYSTPLTCLNELPFPRASDLSQAVNAVIYSVIFSKGLKIQKNDLLIAALFRDIGLLELNPQIFYSSAPELDETLAREYKLHPEKSSDIIRRKAVPLPPLSERIILQHQEHLDGSGFPNRLRRNQILQESNLLGIVEAYSAIYAIRQGGKPIGVKNAWQELKQKDPGGVLYMSELIAHIDSIIGS